MTDVVAGVFSVVCTAFFLRFIWHPRTRFLYPFFAAYLGWLGVFPYRIGHSLKRAVGSLQRITAQQLHLNEVLIVTTSSTGGVMGKMIDAQSIMVACAACYDDPYERAHPLGPSSAECGGIPSPARR